MNYFDLLPINTEIIFRGLTLKVRAVWFKGAVCRDPDEEIVYLSGDDLKEIKLDS